MIKENKIEKHHTSPVINSGLEIREGTEPKIPEVGAPTPAGAVVSDTGTNVAAGNIASQNIVERGQVCGKPRFLLDSKAVINLQSGFAKKQLCDGPTFTAGQACAYSCGYCYVSDILKKNPTFRKLRQDRNLKLEQVVVEITDAAAKVRALLTKGGKAKFADPSDTRVIYGSPLVDIAATLEQARVTVEICTAILNLTHWQIRLLSKSSFLRRVAEQIPAEYKDRVIYGVSTGTLDWKLAASIEKGTALVSKRLETLQWLQDNDYRTFGMVCPILPQQDYTAFANTMAATIDVAKCEHVWAEPINLRGESLTNTALALRSAGYQAEAALLENVMNSKEAWENYARATYEALAAVVPHAKLRFLQYVNKSTKAWWSERKTAGVVILDHAKPKKKKSKTGRGRVAAASIPEASDVE